MALSYINKLYVIEREIKYLSAAERYRIRQELSLPKLDELKVWLETNVTRVQKDSLACKAM